MCIFIDDISLPVRNDSIKRTNIILSAQLVKKVKHFHLNLKYVIWTNP